MEKDLIERGEPSVPKNWKLIRFRIITNTILEKFPRIQKVLLYLINYIRILKYQHNSKKILEDNNNIYDIDKIFWINPKKIQYISLKEFDIFNYKGRIIGGDWDLLDRPFDELDVYVAFKERFIEGKKWETTLFYQRIIHEIENGKYAWDCKNNIDFDKRLKKIELLYENIKTNGYKSQQELFSDNPNPIKLEDEIAVNIGRHGDLLFNNGAHRLAIAKLLNLPQIQIKITVRHPKWVEIRKGILLYAKDQPTGKIYHPITHIDLQDVPSFHEMETSRFNIIKKNLTSTKGCLLDIGAHWGYFCHRFEEFGFNCYAVENNYVNIYFLEKLRRADNKTFTIIPKSIFDFQEISNIDFDVVLALNVFHHFLKTKESYFKLIEMLHNLRVKEMFFEPHNPKEFNNIIVYRNYYEEEFVQFILQNSKLKKAQQIGTAQDGRKIFKLFCE